MTAPVLPLIPTQSTTGNELDRIITTEFGDGYREDAPDGINTLIRKFQLYFENLDTTDYNTLMSFVRTIGSSQKFSWMPFGEVSSFYFKIDKGSLNKTPQAGNIYTVYFGVTQVYEKP